MNKTALKKLASVKSSDVRISLAQSGCLTWYRCSLTSCRHTPGASAACQQARHGLPEAGQTQGRKSTTALYSLLHDSRSQIPHYASPWQKYFQHSTGQHNHTWLTTPLLKQEKFKKA